MEGLSNLDSGYIGHVEGYTNLNYGKYDHIEGNGIRFIASNLSTALGGQHVEGTSNRAFGNLGPIHVEGRLNTDSGMITHVEGDSNVVFRTASLSRVSGFRDTAKGVLSNVNGIGNVGHYGQTIFGAWAVSDAINDTTPTTGQPIFKIGNGTDAGHRADMLYVDANGNTNAPHGGFASITDYTLNFWAGGNAPVYAMYNSNATIDDQHNWDISSGYVSDELQMRAVNDAYNIGYAFLVVQRSHDTIRNVGVPMLSIDSANLTFAKDSMGIVGSIDAVPPRAGIVGETPNHGGGSAGAISLTSGVITAVDSLTLSAGNWLIWANAKYDYTASTVSTAGWQCSVSSTRAGSFVGDIQTSTMVVPTVSYSSEISLPSMPRQRLISAPTVYYLNMAATWTGGSGVKRSGDSIRRKDPINHPLPISQTPINQPHKPRRMLRGYRFY